MSQEKCSTVYSVDDEPFSVHLWIQFEAEGAFPGVVFEGSSDLEGAVSHAMMSEKPTLYVLDGRMPIKGAVFSRMRKGILDAAGINIDDIGNDEIMAGVFGSAFVKAMNPKNRVLLLTAFSAPISNMADKNPTIAKLLLFGCDRVLPKPCSEIEVKKAVAEYVVRG